MNNDIIYMFSIIRSYYTPHLHNWMKKQYCDVCSSGDVIINKILDELNDFYNLKKISVFNKNLLYNSNLIEYIYSDYDNHYMKDVEPDPFWAD